MCGRSNRVAGGFIVLIVLITLAAIEAPRFVAPFRAARSALPAPQIMPSVELWLSTADHKLKLAPQPDIAMSAQGSASADVTIDPKARYQTITGFGAAMTDSSAWLLHTKLNDRQRDDVLRELYGPPPNLNFNMTRLTIGSSDFSLNVYTLDDIPFGKTDPQLKHFNIASNLQDVIPVMREVLAVNPGMLTIASPWGAPAWMRTTQNLLGGELLEQFESTYADYLVKYLDAYRSHGIPIFALTLQNEPAYAPISYPGMTMGAKTRARLVSEYLGPKLAARKPRTGILEWDHNWTPVEEPLNVLADPDAARYIDGVAWHCYGGSQHEQGRVHRAHPDKDAYITECTGGDWPLYINGELLWFTRNLLVTGIRQWARGVVYWNLALDENHGPHFGGCSACKGVITIDSETGAVTRNDEYYALAHFSRFVEPGAFRVNSTDTDVGDKGVANVAFQNETDGSIVLVMVNLNKDERRVSVADGRNRFGYTMPAESVGTFVWHPDLAGLWIRRAQRWLSGASVPPHVEELIQPAIELSRWAVWALPSTYFSKGIGA
ncbi:MAG TPA: glycoside hydrolase family 30 beta sandwich domain-containing protein [Luteibacter sp.]|uniref:glycoside hydrolase family 30 protein n=1 Tax=Luteibacter sp. TaxID=1886636 RepID=UPI002B5B3462|nr:glycoside hydrolase family 30 beta sandwich domain-containing protein [Luteibacter sp.]HVI56642.1 glycoside hydrolase family 30 beta sandwich domain-containing protein [Luteibacter sp.]